MLNNIKLYRDVFKLYHDVFIKENFGSDVILEYPVNGELDTLRICNDTQPETIKRNIKIIVCSHNEEMFTTSIGDNPKKYLEFAVFENDDTEDEAKVKEGRWIIFDDTKYVIKKVYPSNLIGHTFLKDCIAQKER